MPVTARGILPSIGERLQPLLLGGSVPGNPCRVKTAVGFRKPREDQINVLPYGQMLLRKPRRESGSGCRGQPVNILSQYLDFGHFYVFGIQVAQCLIILV